MLEISMLISAVLFLVFSIDAPLYVETPNDEVTANVRR